jgi:AGZA family xanthine/uracil permease-like MFS transporter
MGLYANLPIGVAPYMGENAFIAFGLASMGIGWELRLGTVFISGLVFFLITLFRVRTWLASAISPSMKHSFAVGIGLFLAFIGLYQTGIVTSGAAGLPAQALLIHDQNILRAPDVPVKLGDLGDPRVLLAMAGFVLMAVLLCLQWRGAILIGILVIGALGLALGYAPRPSGIVAWPFSGEYALGQIAGKLDVGGALRWQFLPNC